MFLRRTRLVMTFVMSSALSTALAVPIKVKVFQWKERRIVAFYEEHFVPQRIEEPVVNALMEALRKLKPLDDGRQRQFLVELSKKRIDGLDESKLAKRNLTGPSLLRTPAQYLREHGVEHGCELVDIEVRRLWPAAHDVVRFRRCVTDWDKVAKSRLYENDPEVGSITFGHLRKEIDDLTDEVQQMREKYPECFPEREYKTSMHTINFISKIYNDHIETLCKRHNLTADDTIVAWVKKMYHDTPFMVFCDKTEEDEIDRTIWPTKEEISVVKEVLDNLKSLEAILQGNETLFCLLFNEALKHKILKSDEISDLFIVSGAAHLHPIEYFLKEVNARVMFDWYIQQHEPLTADDFLQLLQGNAPKVRLLGKPDQASKS